MNNLRILSFTLSNLKNNLFLSLSTILITALIIFVFNVILNIHLITGQSLIALQKKVDIILYLNDQADEIKIINFIDAITKMDSVEEVIHTSKQDALANLLSKYPTSINPFQKYEIENPLPSHINILTNSSKNHSEILKLANSEFYSDLFSAGPESFDNSEIINNVLKFTNTTKKVLISTMIIFIITSLLIISNAISISIYNKREEFKIMKLVGAPPKSLIGPFLSEGLIYGISGAAAGILIFLWFSKSTGLNILSFQLDIQFVKFILLQLIFAAIVGLISGYGSIHAQINSKK